MPVPIEEALATNASQAASKGRMLSDAPGRYFLSSMLAGAFVGVAVVLLISVAGPLVATQNAGAKLVQGAVFGIALTLVVFAGAELFTGVVMVMLQGIAARTVTVKQLIGIWIGSWAGNLVGSVAFAALVNASGVLTHGAAPGKATAQVALLTTMVKGKVGLAAGQIFFRAVLCNFLVCLGLWMATRASSDAAKLICLWWSLMAFIASGFEHCVANMTIFALGIFAHVPGATGSAMGHNLLWSTFGNVVGGGLLVAGAYSYIGRSAKPSITIPEQPTVVDEEVVVVREPELAMAQVEADAEIDLTAPKRAKRTRSTTAPKSRKPAGQGV